MISIRMIFASTATLGALVAPASAADLPPIYETPLYQSVPEVQPVEIGSGWYLRGDVGYQSESDIEYDYDVFANSGLSGAGIGSGSFNDLKLDAGANYQFGIGYQLTDFLRLDATLGYWNGDVSRIGYGGLDITTQAKAYELMANAYADLGTFVGITPYVGGGVGGVRMEYEVGCSYFGDSCDPEVSYSGEKDWRLAYSLMAGLSYDVSRNLKIDLGYRYLNVDGGDVASARSVDANSSPTQSVDLKVKDGGFDQQSVRLGLRYSLW